MIFWIENNVKISYDQFFDDLMIKKSSYDLQAYNYFLFLLSELLSNFSYDNLEDLINYFKFPQDDLFFLIQTSGTTSTPKNIKVYLKNCIRQVKFKPDSEIKKIWGMGYPAGSFASTQVFFQAFLNKEPIIYLFGYNFKFISKLISSYKISNLSCTPTFLSMILLNMNEKNKTVKKITTGGEKIKTNLISSFKKVFINAEYINIYASTETGSLLYSNSEFFSIPKKYENLIKIEKGTLRVHSDLLNKSSSVKVEDSWYNTNDVVEYNGDNQFKFISRFNGYLNTGGYRVYPIEIESSLLKINGVIDVHVYGKSNSILGTIICADVIGDKLNSKYIKSELSKSTEKHKIPQIIRIVEKFEYLNNGKKSLMV